MRPCKHVSHFIFGVFPLARSRSGSPPRPRCFLPNSSPSFTSTELPVCTCAANPTLPRHMRVPELPLGKSGLGHPSIQHIHGVVEPTRGGHLVSSLQAEQNCWLNVALVVNRRHTGQLSPRTFPRAAWRLIPTPLECIDMLIFSVGVGSS